MAQKLLRLATTVLLAMVVCCSCETPVQVWVTTQSKSKLLYKENSLQFSSSSDGGDAKVSVNSNTKYQPIDGFGGALTESSAYVLFQMKEKNSDNYWTVLKQLFGKITDTGDAMSINLGVLRVPASASDFSLSDYTYDDTPNDVDLKHLSIDNDKKYVIPVLKDIISINPHIKLIFSPWSAPAWMKTSNNLNKGSLKSDMFEVYANFFVKFIELYKKEGITVHYVTIQNEPYFEPGTYAGMHMTPAEQAKFVKLLGPKLDKKGINTKILVWDHNWDHPEYPVNVMKDSEARKWTAGSAWHCYGGTPNGQMRVYNAYPEKEIHMTECSGGFWAPSFKDNLWYHTKNYYMGSIRNYARSVQHWNLALDRNSGPKNGGCPNCRGIITVNEGDWKSVEYNVEFYGMGQFSKFLTPGSKRIGSSVSGQSSYCVEAMAFENGDGSTHVVILNGCGKSTKVEISNGDGSVSFTTEPGVVTFAWGLADVDPAAAISVGSTLSLGLLTVCITALAILF